MKKVIIDIKKKDEIQTIKKDIDKEKNIFFIWNKNNLEILFLAFNF